MSQFQIKKQVTTNLIKLSKGVEYAFRCEASVYLGKEIPGKDGKPGMEPANMVDVTMFAPDAEAKACKDKAPGSTRTIILPTVAVSEMKRNYPDGVAGKCFLMTMKAPGDGKRYSMVDLAEIEDPAPRPASQTADTAPAKRK
jgi:hypothetical protein